MIIRLRRIVQPGSNSIYALTSVALTVVIMAYSAIIGGISILVMYGLWFPVLIIGYKKFLHDFRWIGFSAVFPIYCILTMFWSDYPPASLRAGIQYFTMALCSLVACRVVSLQDFSRGMVIGVLIVLTVSIMAGGYSYDVIDQSYAFTGLFSSKNQVGLYASLGIYFCFSSYVLLKDRGRISYLYLVVTMVCIYAVIACRSATSILTLGATIAATVGLLFVQRLPTRYRAAATAVGVAAIPVFVGLGYVANIDEVVLASFGKDSSLTGRTYLWSQGIAFGMENPLFGLGYQAFWVQGREAAERLWYEFYIFGRTGFHFHNVYIETFVELGFVGLAMLIATLLFLLIKSYTLMRASKTRRPALLFFGLLMLLIARSTAEVDFLGPFGVGAFLFYTQIGYNALLARMASTQSVRKPATTLQPRRA